MAELVLGIGASHTTLMNTHWDAVNHLPRAHAFRDALKQAAQELRSRSVDLAIIVGSNHFRGHWLDLMPSFCIGVEEVASTGEHGTPAGRQESCPEVSRAICDGLLAREFDIAFSTRMVIDHGISHAIQWLTSENEIPIIPVMINCFAPPLPRLIRCLKLGQAIREICEGLPGEQRIAVIASGGLSHQLPFPDWRSPVSEDDKFLVESWKNGRGNWQEYEDKRRSIIVNSPPRLNEAFDQAFLSALCEGATEAWVRSTSDELTAPAGNGANELRTWLVMHAAMNYQKGKTLAYSPMPEWLTGMGVFATY